MRKQSLVNDKLDAIPLYSSKTKRTTTMILGSVILLYALAVVQTEAYPGKIINGLPIALDFVINDLFPPNFAYYKTAGVRLLETWNIALLSTTLAFIFCLPLSFLASANVNKNKFVYNIVRFVLNILRTIPELILAVILVGVMGLGALSGIGALFLFSLGVLAKLISETIEAVDPRPLEAIEASGGNMIQVIWYGVMPQILPQYASYTLYVLEINVRASIILGFVGAGGIGLILKQQLNIFNYNNVSMIILMTFLAVTIIDFVSNRIRERLL